MPEPTPRDRAHEILPAAFLSSLELAERGMTRRDIAAAARAGRLVRLRRGRFLDPNAHAGLHRAGSLGGRLDCVSLLSALGIFVREHPRLHVQIERGASRLPPRDSRVVAHWRRTQSPRASLAAELIEALAQSCRCQRPRDAIATLDSAWHHGLVDEQGLSEVFARLPRPYRRLRGLLDPDAESGCETLMRLMLRALGCHVELQVRIRGVGRVDLVVDGWLIVECDSRGYHEGWEAQKSDRRRDLAAAALGYTTVRPIAEDILGRPEYVLDLMKHILASRSAAQREHNRPPPGSQPPKPSPMSSISSSRSSTERNAPAAAFSWKASRSSSR